MAETRQHAELKRLAAAAGERLGWSARLEAPAVTPSGRRWVADVLLEKGDRRVAVEVQWSSQPADWYLGEHEKPGIIAAVASPACRPHLRSSSAA